MTFILFCYERQPIVSNIWVVLIAQTLENWNLDTHQGHPPWEQSKEWADNPLTSFQVKSVNPWDDSVFWDLSTYQLPQINTLVGPRRGKASPALIQVSWLCLRCSFPGLSTISVASADEGALVFWLLFTRYSQGEGELQWACRGDTVHLFQFPHLLLNSLGWVHPAGRQALRVSGEQPCLRLSLPQKGGEEKTPHLHVPPGAQTPQTPRLLITVLQ